MRRLTHCARHDRSVRSSPGFSASITDERAWRVGADGEVRVARRLSKLGDSWRLLHSVPVGNRGSDIDHVLIGPAGVFTVNAKNHPRARAWLAGNTLMINGQRVPYVRNSGHEARRAARLLTAHLPFEVPVSGLAVLVGVRALIIKRQPDDRAVVVATPRAAVRWLRRRPRVLTMEQIEEIHRVARRSTTWCPP